MRTKEKILADLKTEEQAYKRAQEEGQRLHVELNKVRKSNLVARFPHLTEEGNGKVSGTLEHLNVLSNRTEYAPTVKLSYVLEAPPTTSDKFAMMRICMSAGSKELRIPITENDLSFLDQLVKDAHAAIKNKKIEIREPLFIPKEEDYE
ncbi:hypothetical protein LD13_gp103 [Bacillus phage Bobb]|uniref:Uncharacterized protein n=1 Tax=Bacillus phage Bobb TaxID=1527469 RepID=A0A076G7R9_9CAUD|nr:hypothetical protein LD13_gp103 [Bacillus phage Bobb]AII28004.1 hypothetical protein [Bacillus phage Bobb]